jgi:menaquinone-dependent protoporphyrinogen oxidase
MSDQRVLVAFANRVGSTAGIAGEIASVLRRAGLGVDCSVAGDVEDVTPYDAIILGSGVFVPRRRSDGGGFLARHAAALASRRVWLFCAGPIGGGHRPVDAMEGGADDSAVTAVARAVGARGTAIFGPIGLAADSDPVERLGSIDHACVRAWATEVAADLATGDRAMVTTPAIRRRHHHGCGTVAVAH